MIREKISNDIQAAARAKLAEGLSDLMPTYRGYEAPEDTGPSPFRQGLDYFMDKSIDAADWFNSGIDELKGYTAEDVSRGLSNTYQDLKGRGENFADGIRGAVSRAGEGVDEYIRQPGRDLMGKAEEKAREGIGEFDRSMDRNVWQPGREVLRGLESGVAASPEVEMAMAREELNKLRNMREGNKALRSRMNDYADLSGIERRQRAEEGRQRAEQDSLYKALMADRLKSDTESRLVANADRGIAMLDIKDSASDKAKSVADLVRHLVRQTTSLGKGTAESVARGRAAAKSDQDIAEAQRDSAMADAAQYDVPEQSLDNIKQMLAGGAQRAGEAWEGADPTAKGLGVAAAGGLGAAGLIKLLRLVAQAKGKKMGPAPV